MKTAGRDRKGEQFRGRRLQPSSNICRRCLSISGKVCSIF